MNLIPERSSLVAQVVEILRRGIRDGLWKDRLPGERPLCKQLQISRPTLRAAMDQLRREGLIEVAQGASTRIRPGMPRTKQARSRVVALLTPIQLERVRPFVSFWIDELREHLQDADYRLAAVVDRGCYQKHPFRALEALVRQTPAACWVLYLSTERIQRWFFERGIPTVVAGSSQEGVALPSVDVDYRAACRHAVDMFLAKGHRRMALVMPRTGRAGDLLSEQGFLDASKQIERRDVRAVVIHHNGTVEGIQAALDSAFGSGMPPTAALVGNSSHVLTVMGHLMQMGLRIPTAVSIISRDDEPFLEFVVPSVARYSCSPSNYARRLSALAVGIARSEMVTAREVRIMPKLIRGETLATYPNDRATGQGK